jgi:tripeptide aminopeptidase
LFYSLEQFIMFTIDLPDLEDRFLRYVRIDSQSDERSSTAPSTASQWEMLRLLEKELGALGAQEVRLTDYGCVIASLPATVAHATPVVALLAHVDTTPQFKASGVKPLVHRNYNGQPITLPDDPSQVLSPAEFPYLAQKQGHDLVTASGTTLLGADDKAGVAIIMALARHLLAHPELPHGEVRLCFTSDEEIGVGIRRLALEDLRADVAYTLDGGDVGALCYETFSADKAVVKITGISIHPGWATGKMVNASHLAAKLLELLPKQTRTPDTTSGRQGFIHAYQMSGGVGEAEISFILRDFELDGLEAHGQLLRQLCAAVQASEPRARFEVTITKQYRNMRYWLEDDKRPVDLAAAAIRKAGIEPICEVVRGGTDGSQLTERGLPTPNLFTGMQNVHGPLEWISLQDMAKATEVCIHLVGLWAERQA